MIAEVDGAKRLPGKALDQRRAPFIGGVGEEELVDLRPVFGIAGIERGLAVVDRAQTVHVALPEQVTAFADLLHQLFETDRLPFSLAPFAHPLHGLQHAVGTVQLLQHGRSPRARGGAAFQSAVAAELRIDVAHRRVHGCGPRRGQRVVWVACNAQDAVFRRIHTQAHAALRPAAQTARRADDLAGLGAKRAGQRIDAEFRGQRVAAHGVRRRHARRALRQALGRFDHGVSVARRKGRHAAGHDAAAHLQFAPGLIVRLVRAIIRGAALVVFVLLVHCFVFHVLSYRRALRRPRRVRVRGRFPGPR